MKIFIKCLIVILLFPAFGFCDKAKNPAARDINVKLDDTKIVRPLTLIECYKLALIQSEIIAITGERIKEAEAHFLQAFGTIMPQASFEREELRQRSYILPTLNKGFDQYFSFTQQLFTGFKEFARMAASKLDEKARTDERTRAEQLLFVDVSDSFYLLIEQREDLKTLEIIKKALFDRINDLREREKIGKSRKSEVVMTEVQLYSLEAEMELVRSQERVACELLSFLIGGPVDEVIDTDYNIKIKPEQEYVAEAPLRKDVLAAKNDWLANMKRITVAKSGYLPKVDLEGDVFTHRFSSPKDAHWAAYLNIDVPIFSGTITYGDVKEATAIARSSELLFQRKYRVAVREIHDAYTIVNAAMLRTRILENAMESAQLNYELQTEDYKLNCVNNLDVLSSIQTLYSTRRDLIHATYQSKRYYWQLRSAAGEIETRD